MLIMTELTYRVNSFEHFRGLLYYTHKCVNVFLPLRAGALKRQRCNWRVRYAVKYFMRV